MKKQNGTKSITMSKGKRKDKRKNHEKDENNHKRNHISNINEESNVQNTSVFKIAQTRYRHRPQTDDEWRQLSKELIDFSNPQQKYHPQYPAIQLETCIPNISADKDWSIDERYRLNHKERHQDCDNKSTKETDAIDAIDGSEEDIPLIHSDTESFEVSCPKHVYTLSAFPGLLYIPNAISEKVQLQIAHLALSQYCESPHVTNIDSNRKQQLSQQQQDQTQEYDKQLEKMERNDSNKETMWNLWKNDQKQQQQQQTQNKRKHKKEEIKNKHITKNKQQSYRTLKKLSWSTMGYHYDWTHRLYREDAKSDIPFNLQQVAKLFSSCYSHGVIKDLSKIWFPSKSNATLKISETNWNKREASNRNILNLNSSQSSIQNSYGDMKPFHFDPTACIINFYNLKSIMGGHADDLEYTFDKPVISISMGLPAIFLLGGYSKMEGPVIPILIQKGDVLMLGGQSRLRYHGMTRVFEWNELKKLHSFRTNHDSSMNESMEAMNAKTFLQTEMDYVRLFLSTHRININLRQVLPDGFTSIPEYQSKINLENDKKTLKSIIAETTNC